MTDDGLRRSGRTRRAPTCLYDVYSHEGFAVDEADGSQPIADVENPDRSDNAVRSQSRQGRDRKERQRLEGSQQPAERQLAVRQDERVSESELAVEQHVQRSERAAEAQLAIGAAVRQTRRHDSGAAASAVAKSKKAPIKRKKTKYDPAPMKAVAEHAQDILEPVSQISVPAAVAPCAALNCRPSAPVRCEAS